MSGSDDRVPIERVLEHAPWVHALAHSLVRDGDLADDIVQQTWVAAMRSPPRSLATVRAWLRAVVVNFANESYRTRRTREAREIAGPARDAAPSAAWLLEEAESHRVVTDAVVALPAIYRTVVMLRFYEGLQQREIAAHLDLPVQTVKTRLRRALDLLRVALDDHGREHGTSRALLLAPLLWRPPAPADAPVGGGGAPRIGLRWIAASAAVALGVVAVFSVRAQRDAPTLAARGDGASPTARGSPRQRGRAVPTATAPSASGDADAAGAGGADATPPDPSARMLALSVGGAEGLGPVRLRVVPIFADPYRADATPVESVAVDGRATLSADAWDDAANPVVSIDVVPDDLRLVPAPFRVAVADLREAAAGRQLTAEVFRAQRVSGRVVVPDGSAANVTVAAFRTSAGGRDASLVDRTTAGPDGGFELRLWPGEPQTIVAATQGLRPACVRVDPRDETPADVGTLTLERGFAVSGRVRAPDGAAPPGLVRVSAQGASPDVQIPFPGLVIGLRGDVADFSRVEVSAGPDGAFAIPGLPAAQYEVTIAGLGLAGDLIVAGVRRVTPPTDGVDLVPAGTAIDVVLPPTADATRALVDPPDVGPTTTLRFVGGRATLRGTPGVRYAVRARCSTGEELVGVAEPSATDPGRVVVLRPRGAHAGVSVLDLALADPVSVGTVALSLYEIDAHGVAARLTTLERDVPIRGGAAQVELPLVGRFRAVARLGTTRVARASQFVDASAEIELSPETPALWTLHATPGGRLRILSHDGAGRPARDVRCRILHGGEVLPTTFVDRDPDAVGTSNATLSRSGVTELAAALAPGAYVVECTAPDGRTVRAEAAIHAGRETTVAVVLDAE